MAGRGGGRIAKLLIAGDQKRQGSGISEAGGRKSDEEIRDCSEKAVRSKKQEVRSFGVYVVLLFILSF